MIKVWTCYKKRIIKGKNEQAICFRCADNGKIAIWRYEARKFY